MTRGQTPVLSEELAAKLKAGKNGHKKDPQCDSRGCLDIGVYSLRRVTRGGNIHSGLYCDKHEAIYAKENLKRYAEEAGGKVVIMVDEEGAFEGILV